MQEFAKTLGEFFTNQWTASGMPTNLPDNQDMFFFIAGYDEGAAYGRLFQLHIPHAPQPQELFTNQGEFGATWGGQREITDRLLVGFDPAVPNLVQDLLGIPANQRRANFELELKQRLITPIPWQFLPLQDCVDSVDLRGKDHDCHSTMAGRDPRSWRSRGRCDYHTHRRLPSDSVQGDWRRKPPPELIK